jgi:hypothetical protein
VRLNQEEMDRLITWIDLNAPYYPTGFSARPGPAPGRNPLTDPRTQRFLKLTGFVRDDFLKADRYPGPQVSFDRPELSPCLTRIEDEHARAEALTILEAGKESLLQLPRADMPGFSTLHEADEDRRQHQEKYRQIEQQVRAAIRNGEKVYDVGARTRAGS